jgi:hypothetical protein
MARAPAAGAKPPAKIKNESTALVNYEQQMEAQAEKATNQEKGGGFGKSFSFKGGILSFDGAPIKGNQIPVLVAGSMIEKALYEGRYDPNNIEPPVCFAFSDDVDTLAPNPEDVADLKNDDCETCPFNQWGSADVGRGKACKDIRRLALIPAGTIAKNGDIEMVDDVKTIQKAEFGYAKLPPTSLNAWASFVRGVASTLKRPPHGVFAMMSVEPDDTNQFKVTFEALDMVPSKLLPAIMPRHEEAMKELVRPYTYPTEEQKADRAKQAKKGARGTPAGRPGTGTRGVAAKKPATARRKY